MPPPLVPTDRAPDRLENQNRSEGFGDKIERTQPQRAHRLAKRSVGGDDDYLDSRLSIAEPNERLGTAPSRHAQVERHDRNWLLLEDLESLLAAIRNQYPVVSFENQSKRFTRTVLVVDDKDCMCPLGPWRTG